MNAIRKKLADLLLDMSSKALDGLDAESPCTRAMGMKSSERSALLRSDIERVCTEISIVEAGRLLAISAKLRSSSTEARERHRKRLVDIASGVVARLERKRGSLSLPLLCRDFLVNLPGNP
jgi:hypothetical protein